MKKILILIFSALFLLTGLSVKADTSFSVAAKSAIAIDASSGKILYAQNATDSSCQIASITKLITAYLVYKNISEGKLSWETKAPISQYAYDLTQNLDASNIPLVKGEKISVKDLMDALLLPSANSAAVALAEKIAGSEPKFVDMMRAQLKSWGITDAVIYNASGLPNDVLGSNIYPGSSTTATNTMSAEDVAIVSYHLLKEYPQILKITKQKTLAFDTKGASKTTLKTTNQMLGGFAQSRSGVDGLKSGSTGYQIDCFAGTTVQNGFRVITVVLDADNPASDNSTPFLLSNQLMNHVYGSWIRDTLIKKGKPYSHFSQFNVVDGKKLTVPLISQAAITTVVPRKTDGTADTSQISSALNKKKSSKITAPVEKGQRLAIVTTRVNDKLGYLPGTGGSQADLVAQKMVSRANPVVILWGNFVNFVNEKL